MLRSHHHLRGFDKLVLWDVYCVNGCGSYRLGYVGIGFGGNCDCRYGISYAGGWFLWVWLFCHLRNFLFPAGVVLLRGFCYVFVCVGPAHLVFLWERKQACEMFCFAINTII